MPWYVVWAVPWYVVWAEICPPANHGIALSNNKSTTSCWRADPVLTARLSGPLHGAWRGRQGRFQHANAFPVWKRAGRAELDGDVAERGAGQHREDGRRQVDLVRGAGCAGVRHHCRDGCCGRCALALQSTISLLELGSSSASERCCKVRLYEWIEFRSHLHVLKGSLQGP